MAPGERLRVLLCRCGRGSESGFRISLFLSIYVRPLLFSFNVAEVAKDDPYDKSVDVYSFGILLWEMCTAEKPFYGYSSGKHLHQVVLGGQRPDLDRSCCWPRSLRLLMERCWAESPSERPTFTVIKQVLSDILDGREASVLAGGGAPEVESASRLAFDVDGDGRQHGGLSAVFRSHNLLPVTGKPPVADGDDHHHARRKSWGFGLKR